MDASSRTLDELYDARKLMELEMGTISARLSAPGAPGLKGSLVDREGFPIAGCDLYAVRSDRQRYNTLRNDYETITNAITVKMAEKFSERRGVESITSGVRDVSASSPKPAPPVSPVQTMDTNAAARAFAIIDQVMDDSPGCVDGLRVGDRVCAVGDVRWGFDDPSATPPSDLIPQAARAFGESENHPVRVVILRRGERVEITVTPRAWSGAGLVGCHMCTV